MKKILSVLLIICLSFSLCACDIFDFSQTETMESPEPIVIEAPRKKDPNEGKTEIVIAGVSSQSVKDAVELFSEKVSEYSKDSIIVQYFPDNIMGNDIKQWEMLKSGDIDIAIGSTSEVSSVYNDFYIYDIPYFFFSRDEATKIGLSGTTANKVLEGFEEEGLKGLAMWDNGFRCIATTDKLVEKVEDLKGLKICTNENELYSEALKMMGIRPIPIKIEDFLSKVQRRETSGIEGTPGDFLSNDIHIIEKYCMFSEHIYSPFYVAMNMETWKDLNQEQQDAVKKAIQEATEFQIYQSNKYENDGISVMENAGCKVVMFDEETKYDFRKIKDEETLLSIAKERMIHPEYVDEMNEELIQYRG